MNFYIQVIDDNGVPQRLIGPGTYENCEEKGCDIANEQLQMFEQRNMNDEEKEGWKIDGSLKLNSGAGVYIVCSEDFETNLFEPV